MTCPIDIPDPSSSQDFTVVTETCEEWFHVFCDEKYPVDARSFSEGHGNTRFAPLIREDGKTPEHTYYMASTAECAYMESILHDIPLSPPGFLAIDRLKYFHLVTLRLVLPLVTVSLHSKYLPKINLDRQQLIDSPPACYPQTRKWAQAAYLQVSQSQGIAYGSRRDDSARCLMVFRHRLAGNELSPTFAVQSEERLDTEPRRSELVRLIANLGISMA